jgi:hypothetical protein
MKVRTIVAVICVALAGSVAVPGGRPVQTGYFLHNSGPVGS